MFLKIARFAGLLAVVAGLAGFLTSTPAVEAKNRGSGGSSATAREVRVGIRLVGVDLPAAHGKAVFKSKGARHQLEVEIEDADRIAGEVVFFYLGETQIGRATVDAFGEAHLRLGHPNAPATVAGLRLTVRLASDTTIVIAGGAFPS